MTDFMRTPTYIPPWQGPTPAPSDTTFPCYAVRNGSEQALIEYYGPSQAVLTSRDLMDYVSEKRASVVASRRADLASTAYAKLAPYDGVIANAPAEVAALENSLADRKVPTDAASIQRQGWIVNWFMGLQADARVIALAKAMDESDVETLSAILGAPACWDS